MSRQAWLILLMLSLIWGAAFTFAGAAVRELGFITVVFLRVSLAAMALLLFLGIQRQLPPLTTGLIGAFLIMGLFNNAVPFSLLFWAQSPPLGSEAAKVSSGLASIFNATTPLFSMLVATFAFRDESISLAKLMGIGLGLIGVVVLFLGQAQIQGQGFGLNTLGLIACVGAALSYGFAVAFGRRFGRQGLKPAQGALGQLCASTVLMLPLSSLWIGLGSCQPPPPYFGDQSLGLPFYLLLLPICCFFGLSPMRARRMPPLSHC